MKRLGSTRSALAVALLLASASPVVAATEGGLVAAPLTDSPHPRGATLFTTLPGEVTGIVAENRYDDPRMRGELYQEFETSSIGTGVAIGDYDGDGRPDVFVTSKTESSRLFRNLGGWKFADVTEQAGVGDHGAAAGVWKQGAAFADVNNDGRLDLYVCRFDAPNLLYVNQGDGTFREEAKARGLDVHDSSVMAAFADYDRDGWLDVYVTTNILNIAASPSGQRGHLFRNNGKGADAGFVNVTERAGIYGEGQSHAATWWDYDQDGWPDLYVGHDYGVPDRLYRNNSDGTFTDRMDAAVPRTSFSTMGMDLGDVNNDGRIDFLAADMAATTHVTDQRFMADARGRTEERAAADRATPKFHRNALLLNTGVERTLEAASLAGIGATDWTWSVRFEDLDNDGWLDLFATNGFPRAPSVDVIRRMMQATSRAERIRAMYDSPLQAEANFAFRNRGDLEFEDVSAAWGLNHVGVSFGAAFGDLDGDGDLDIVHANYRGNSTVLRNDADRGHRVLVELRGTVSNRFGIGAVVTLESARGRQVRPLTLARGYLSTSEPVVHFGLGDDTRVRRLAVAWPSGHVQVFEDLPADRRFTITEPSSAVPRESQAALVRESSGQFDEVSASLGLNFTVRGAPVDDLVAQPLLPMRISRRGPSLAVAEFDDTGRRIVFVGGTTEEPARMLLETPERTFAAVPVEALASAGAVNDGPALWLEANGDGHVDLLIAKAGGPRPADAAERQPVLLLGDGRGGFVQAPADALPMWAADVGALAAVDFDRDGRLDVFVGERATPGRYPVSPRSALWRNRGPSAAGFEDVTERVAPELREVGMVTSALWSDVDDDGWPDLLLALDWGPVKCFRNEEGRRLADWTERAGFAAAGHGWWTSIAAADFNGDERPDFVVGNLGLNTPYQASPDSPAVLLAGDFNADGSLQLLEAFYEGDTLYPRRSRRDLGSVFPDVLKRYRLNADFARATLAELFGEPVLAQAQRSTATEFRSGVFLSAPDGTHRFEPLPRLAQIAPLQGIVTGDFDGDGHVDIFAVQNSYAPIPAVGWFNGGLSQLLSGDGRGGFTPVPAAESGLVVPRDAEALVALDWNGDGWADFLTTRHSDTMLAFENRGASGARSLRILLRGPPGNPTAIGARVTVKLRDGTAQSSEMHAGSGCFSQSPAAGFFGYPERNPPKDVRVRWPDGSRSRHEIPPGASVLVLSPPAQ